MAPPRRARHLPWTQTARPWLLGLGLCGLVAGGPLAVLAEDVQVGAGRLNVSAALAVASVPQVRLTSPTVQTVFSPAVDLVESCGLALPAGQVALCGTAAGPGFAQYTLAWARDWAPTSWTTFKTSTSAVSVSNGRLGEWVITDPAVFTPDRYTLKLEVTTTDNRHFTTMVPVAIENAVRLTTDPAAQRAPAISGTRIVWQDYRHLRISDGAPQWEIYTCQYNAVTKSCDSPQRLTTHDADQTIPAIAGNVIVWVDWRTIGNADLYVCNYTGTCTPQPLVPAASAAGDQTNPTVALDGSTYRIVWESAGDLYTCQYPACAPVQLTTDPAPDLNPALTGHRLVWEKQGDLYTCDVTACTPQPLLPSDAAIQTTPAVATFNDPITNTLVTRIVWAAGGDIYACQYTAGTCTPQQLTTDPLIPDLNPAISGTQVVWEDQRDLGNYDIYRYDLASRILSQVTVNRARQRSPAIAGNRIVWVDERNRPATNQNNDDLYLYEIGPNQPPRANPLAPLVVNAGDFVTLDGRGSSDPDGDVLTAYAWRQVEGTAMSFTPSPTTSVCDALPAVNAETASFTAPTVSGPNQTLLRFELKVKDGQLCSPAVMVPVLVNPPLDTLTITGVTPNASSGPAPLNGVSFSVNADGTLTDKNPHLWIDCRYDGVTPDFFGLGRGWHISVNDLTPADPLDTVLPPYVTPGVCSYANPGPYTVLVKLTAGSLSPQYTTTITVNAAAPTLSIWTFAASLSSGPTPLNGVSFTTDIGGTATGNIRYRIDCDASNGLGYDSDVTNTSDPYTTGALCDYASGGFYTATVEVTRQNLVQTATTTVHDPTVSIWTFAASPSSGPAPLNGVNFTVWVGGTATGPMTIEIDCDLSFPFWVFDRSYTTSDNPFTTSDGPCSYPWGTWTPGVKVTRQSTTQSRSTTISATNP